MTRWSKSETSEHHNVLEIQTRSWGTILSRNSGLLQERVNGIEAVVTRENYTAILYVGKHELSHYQTYTLIRVLGNIAYILEPWR